MELNKTLQWLGVFVGEEHQRRKSLHTGLAVKKELRFLSWSSCGFLVGTVAVFLLENKDE
ncbi:MAG: hypothetical protein WKF91_10065 [Segetibacter sp.]